MDNLMRASHLVATDAQFRTAFGVDPESTLARYGLTLNKLERKAIDRVWEMIKDLADDSLIPFGMLARIDWNSSPPHVEYSMPSV